ncbi:MAG: histidine--tRNA ligase [Betaproteobacteria bacterium RIFCSPHIGHO2_12_FULL_69_13]|nr:MAG: histidine--tRNA ligase [Betaproteobacteria bacterium RIFCSPHIGHO2_12_FULL_69_13]OGA69201.1 MAG: histidine--tRNA ligase [Betaproteobacteria bacterium RIFCSPLOWO2_12_FULL_68_20]
MSQTIQAVRGMNDVLPDEAGWWLEFEAKVEAWLERYGYRNIRLPLVEHTQLFRRAIGEATDIVEKEMYSWRDELNDEELTLRPEGTASCVRAAIEHSLLHDGPKRLWYAGPMYRHERPQKGRYRQFHQYGVEALGYAGPDIDAELIVMCAALWRELGLQDVRLELNTIGSPAERARYRADLVRHLEQHLERLDADAKRRLHTNPLRTLDSKNPMVQEVVASAPALADYLGEASLAHFEGLKRLLEAAGIRYAINPRLVRGLDYYNLTVFEWISDRLGAQGTVCGGGRYDGLFAQLGGKPAPATGFAMGNERLIALMRDAGSAPPAKPPRAYVVFQGEGTIEYALSLAEELRRLGYRVVQHAGGGSFKSQMRKADASGAVYALIVGEDELRAGEVSVKPLREPGEQRRIARGRVAEALGD